MNTRLSHEAQVEVFYRDAWLCHFCRRPLIFAPALKRLASLVGDEPLGYTPAYFNEQWRRDEAPLLDELAACVGKVEVGTASGPPNPADYAAECAKCNHRKRASDSGSFVPAVEPWEVKGKFGEPTHWDGLASVFVFLASSAADLSPTERSWLRALQERAKR